MATKKTAAAAKPATAAAAKKAAPAKAAAAKAAEPAAAPAEVVEGGAGAAAARPASLKIKDLVARVTEATGGKKKDVKTLVEATLKALGDAMAAGEDMNLPGLGRARITRSAEKDGASHMTLKVKRMPHRPKHAEEPLAEEPEDS